MEAVICHNVSHSMYPFVHTSLLAMFIARVIGVVLDLWLLLHSVLCPHQDSSLISCCCPVSWRFCSFGSIGPHALAPHRWGGCWGGLTKSTGSGHGGSWVGQPANSSVPKLPEQCPGEGWGQLSCSHALRAGSPKLSGWRTRPTWTSPWPQVAAEVTHARLFLTVIASPVLPLCA